MRFFYDGRCVIFNSCSAPLCAPIATGDRGGSAGHDLTLAKKKDEEDAGDGRCDQ